MAQEEPSGLDHYERGLLMRKVQSFESALKEFQQATKIPEQAGKAFVQLALCLRTLNRHDEAVAAFRQAMETNDFSTKERVHILYLLGQTLESLDRDFEALVVYRRIRREDANFKDVETRIQELSASPLDSAFPPPSTACHEGDVLNLWEQMKPHLASLMSQTWQKLASYTEMFEAPHWGKRSLGPIQKWGTLGTVLKRGNSAGPINRSLVGEKAQSDKRRHGRVAVQLLSQFSSKTQMVVAGEGELRDLSPGGCRITSPVRVPLGTALECWIYPQDGHPLTVEEATVQWSRHREFGLVFTKMRPSVQRQITDICRKVAPL